jgi:hypothetical protein
VLLTRTIVRAALRAATVQCRAAIATELLSRNFHHFKFSASASPKKAMPAVLSCQAQIAQDCPSPKLRQRCPRVSSNYNVWAVENIFYYVPNKKVLGGNLGFMVIFPTLANGSLVVDFPNFPNLGVTGVEQALPIYGFSLLPWAGTSSERTSRVGDAFMVPTGPLPPWSLKQRWDRLLWQPPSNGKLPTTLPRVKEPA